MNIAPLLFTRAVSTHIPFALQQSDGWPSGIGGAARQKHLNISVIIILVINLLRISRCATVGYLSFIGSRRCSSQVQHPSVASISEPLPLRSLHPLCLFLSVMRRDLEWKALGCMPNGEKEKQPQCSKSLMCAWLKISLRTQVIGSTRQWGRAQNSSFTSFLLSLRWQTAKKNLCLFDLPPSYPMDVFQYPSSNTWKVIG